MKKPFFFSSFYLGIKIAIIVALYIGGITLMKSTDIESLKEMGYAEQEEYSYTNSDGEDVEGETLISIKGIGKVLTYKDVYLAAFPLLVFTIIFWEIPIKNVDNSNSGMGKQIFFSFSLLGIALIWLTTKGFHLSTVMFWLTIIISCFFF